MKISNLKPSCCILATCTKESVARSLMLNWGVYPVVTKLYESTDEIVSDAIEKSKSFAKLNEKDIILITGGFMNSNNIKTTDFMKIQEI